MKYSILLFFLLFYSELVAQNQLIGLRNNSLTSYIRDQQTLDVAENNDFFNRQILDIDLILGHKVSKKNILWLTRLGFVRSTSESERLITNSQDTTLTTTDAQNATVWGYKLAFGVEKIFEFNKFRLNTGVELPFKYFPHTLNERTTTYYTNDVFAGCAKQSRDLPASFTVGVNLLGRFYYQMNRWSAGIELTMGIEYQQYSPENTSTQQIFDENNELIQEDSFTINKKENLLRSVQNFAIGVQYHFNLKNPNKKDKDKQEMETP